MTANHRESSETAAAAVPDARREASISWLAAHPVEVLPGFYLEGDLDIDHRGEWCVVHARRAARLLTHLWRQHGGRAYAMECWTGDEDVQYCRTCHVPLDTGGIIDAARAVRLLHSEILEGEDYRLPGFVAELSAYADSLDSSNPAWDELCDLIERAAAVTAEQTRGEVTP